MLIPGRIRATFHGIDTGDVGAQVLGAVALGLAEAIGDCTKLYETILLAAHTHTHA